MFAGIFLVIGGALTPERNSYMYTSVGSLGLSIPDAVTKWPEAVSPDAGRASMSNTQDRWSNIVSCEQCGRNNPADILLCLNCGQQFKRRKRGLQPTIRFHNRKSGCRNGSFSKKAIQPGECFFSVHRAMKPGRNTAGHRSHQGRSVLLVGCRRR